MTSLVYICSISAPLMYVLCRSHVFLCTTIMTAVCFGIFWIFYKLRFKKIFAVLAFVGLLILVNVVCGAVGGSYGEGSFLRFLFTSSDFFNPFYAGAAILLFSMIIGFSTSYFTVYLPRPCFLLLPAFIPMILAARTMGTLPIGYVIFLAVGFILASMGLARPEAPSGEVYINDKKARGERLIAFGVLGVAAALLLMIIPKVEQTRYSDYMDSVLLRPGNRSYFGTQQLSNFQDRSRPNVGNNTLGTDVLFAALTNYPMNVSKSSYDVYLGDDGWSWAEDEEISIGHSNWENKQSGLNYSQLINKLKRGAENGLLDDYKDELDKVPISRSVNAVMTIRVMDGSSTAVILHPQRTYGVTIADTGETVYRNSKDEMFTRNEMQKNSSYLLNYYIELPNAEFIDMLERVDLSDLLYEAASNGVISAAEYSGFITERSFAENYGTEFDRSISEYFDASGVKALADEITAGLTNDYEKALAIEKWFGDAGFVYDLDFVPEEATSDYFMFDSKRGICTDFATASTLLLRAAGIPARYTEGFVMPESVRDNLGRYLVTAAQAHAYSEAYIDGYGWLTVDGTRYAEVSSSIEEALRIAAIVIVAVAVVLTVLAIVFRRQISEFLFMMSLKFKDKDGRIRAIYLRTRKLACGISDKDPKTATSDEVLDIISRTLYITDEAEEITTAANELLYSTGSPNADDKRLYQDYKTICKRKRSQGR